MVADMSGMNLRVQQSPGGSSCEECACTAAIAVAMCRKLFLHKSSACLEVHMLATAHAW